jgi:hypothetical protein
MPITWTSSGPEPVEIHNTRQATYGMSGSSASVSLLCDEDDAAAIVEDMVGNSTPWPYAGPVPLYASTATIVTLGEAGTNNGSGLAYDQAQINVSYAALTPDDDQNPSVFYDEQLQPTCEMLLLPPDGFYWSSGSADPLLPEEAPSKLRVGFDYNLTVFNQVTIPAHVLTHPGKVNASSVTSGSLGLTFAAQTLLYNPPLVSRSVSLGGSNRYTISYRLSYRADTWNKYWRTSTGAFAVIKDSTGTTVLVYPTADFSGIVP